MIKATFITEKNKVILDISGHAGADEKGKDLVCASASILMYTFLQDVSDAFKMNKLKKKPIVDIDFENGGKAHIEAECKKDDYAGLLHTLFIIQKGCA